MRDHKLNPLQNDTGVKGSKSNKSKRKSFGYQILGFGSGGVAAKELSGLSIMLLAGGGGGDGVSGTANGGGGAGGMRILTCQSITYTAPMAVVIGSGGAGGSPSSGKSPERRGCAGGNTTFNCLSASGGGEGRQPGGSGGGSGHQGSGGTGNAGGFSPPEGANGGSSGGGCYA